MITTEELKVIFVRVQQALVEGKFSVREGETVRPTDRRAVIRMGSELHDAVTELRGTVMEDGDAWESMPEARAMAVCGHCASRAQAFQPRAFQVCSLETFAEIAAKEREKQCR